LRHSVFTILIQVRRYVGYVQILFNYLLMTVRMQYQLLYIHK